MTAPSVARPAPVAGLSERQLEAVSLAAQHEGLRAAARDEPQGACPYPSAGSVSDQARRRNWLRGWQKARRRTGPAATS